MVESFIFETKIDATICDRLVDEFERNIDSTKFDPDRGYIRYSSKQLSKPLFDVFTTKLHQCVEQYYNHFEWCATWSTPIKLWDFNIQKYDPTKAYSNWHIEDAGPVKNKPLRKLTWMTYLNDVWDGGETQFLYQSRAFFPRKGNTLIWPAGWTHPHRGVASPSETKYIATGWFVYDGEQQEN